MIGHPFEWTYAGRVLAACLRLVRRDPKFYGGVKAIPVTTAL